MSSPAIRLWLPLFLAASALPSHGQERFRQLHRMFPPKDDPSPTAFTSAAKLVDVDGDGDPDILTAAVWSYGGLFKNDGSGVFTAVDSALPPVSGYDLATADLDGDGDADAYVPAHGPDAVLRNDGAGVFTQVAGAVPTDNSSARCVALGDVDQDGDNDALVGNQQLCSLSDCTGGWGQLYLNDSTGVFQQTLTLPLTVWNTLAISMGDLDGDGDLDGLAACEISHGVLLLGDGAGSFTEAPSAPQPDQYPTAIPLADVDGDGDLDAVIGNIAGSSLWLNDGSGAFTGVVGGFPYSDYTYDVSLGDVDGDGAVDAVLANLGEERLFLNAGGVFVDAPVPLPLDATQTGTVCLGDVDGDGDADAFFGGHADRLCLNDGAGVFVDPSNSIPYDNWTGGAALGDVDGDGDADAILVAFDGVDGKDHLYLNNGAGSLSEAPVGLPADPFSSIDVALGDVDGDGDNDVLTGAGCAFVGAPDLDRLYLNDGAGVFSDATANLPSIQDCTNAVALGDLDLDGDLDAFLGNTVKNRMYTNNGAGVFVDAPSSLPPDNGKTAAVALGDVDGNGSLDVLVTNSVNLQCQLLLNSGTGVFTDASSHLPILFGPGNAPAVALCDVDGDLDLDAWIGVDEYGTQTRLLINNGASFFTDATASLPAGPGWTHALAPGDLDGDGDLDLLLGNSQQDSFWRNDGAGVFSDASAEFESSSDDTTALALQDLDGDGDLDVLLGTKLVPSRVLANLTRQVAWRGLPRLGKPLDLDLWGTPAAPWFLAASLGAVSIPLPPFGTLLIDPAHLLITGWGLLDGAGRAAPHLQVPSQPGLLGVAVRWQAVLGNPLLFSNLELTVLTGF